MPRVSSPDVELLPWRIAYEARKFETIARLVLARAQYQPESMRDPDALPACPTCNQARDQGHNKHVELTRLWL